MTDLLPDQIPDGWNRTSAAYDRDIWGLMRPFVENAVDLAGLEPDSRVLDIAAGTGAVTIAAAPRVGTVLAVDFAGEMLARLRDRAERAGLANVSTAVMDGQALELEDASFDAVLSNFGAIFFPDRIRGFWEMRRVLRPGGRAVVTAWSAPDRFELLGTFVQAVRAVLGDAHRPEGPPPVFSLADRDRFEFELRAGGFDDVAIHTVTHTFEVDSPEAYWQVMSKSAPPAVALLERIGPEAAKRVRDTLLDQLARRFGDGRISLSNEAHIGVAAKAPSRTASARPRVAAIAG